MKSFRKTALALSAGVLWAASAAAQVSPYGSPSLLPLPESGPQLQAYPSTAFKTSRRGVVNPTQPGDKVLAQNGEAVAPPEPAPAPPVPPADGAEYGAAGQSDAAQGGYTPAPPAPQSALDIGGGSAPGCTNGNCASGNNSALGINPNSSSYDAALQANGWGADCAGYGVGPSYARGWFGGFAGLVLGRNNANNFFTTYETNNNPNQLMHFPQAKWGGGGEVFAGKWFSCGCNGATGVMFSFFTVDPLTGSNSISSANNTLSTPIDLGFVNIGNNTAGQFFDNAHEHRVSRKDEIQNYELNLLHQQYVIAPGRCQMTWLAGIRYFRFDETILFGSAAGGFNFGDNGGIHEAYLNTRVVNNLMGVQVGARADYFINPRWSLFAIPKMGVYGNQLNKQTMLYRGDGLTSINVTGHKADVSLLGQLDLGMNYRISQHWSTYGGYRAIGVTGIGLSDANIPAFLNDTAFLQNVNSNGSLILHGAFTGVQFCF